MHPLQTKEDRMWTCDKCKKPKHSNKKYPKPTGPGPHTCGSCRGKLRGKNKDRARKMLAAQADNAYGILKALSPVLGDDIIDVTFPGDRDCVKRLLGTVDQAHSLASQIVTDKMVMDQPPTKREIAIALEVKLVADTATGAVSIQGS